FYSERLAACEGSILEPGAGTGRIRIPLLKKGWRVDGFDVSGEMLKVCRNNCESRGLHPKLFEAKMETFSLDTEYEAIIVPTGTFFMLYKREDSRSVLKNFYHHLSDGGKLILDIFLQPHLSVGPKTSTSTWKPKTD